MLARRPDDPLTTYGTLIDSYDDACKLANRAWAETAVVEVQVIAERRLMIGRKRVQPGALKG